MQGSLFRFRNMSMDIIDIWIGVTWRRDKCMELACNNIIAAWNVASSQLMEFVDICHRK